MGPGFFDDIYRAIFHGFLIVALIAFVLGLGVSSCLTSVGHPTVSWSK